MTSNQIAYWRNEEEKRKNQASEYQRAYEASIANKNAEANKLKAQAAWIETAHTPARLAYEQEKAQASQISAWANMIKSVAGAIIPGLGLLLGA